MAPGWEYLACRRNYWTSLPATHSDVYRVRYVRPGRPDSWAMVVQLDNVTGEPVPGQGEIAVPGRSVRGPWLEVAAQLDKTQAANEVVRQWDQMQNQLGRQAFETCHRVVVELGHLGIEATLATVWATTPGTPPPGRSANHRSHVVQLDGDAAAAILDRLRGAHLPPPAVRP
jgi:hypothetical protein